MERREGLSVAVLTGAGISAESGVATFRGSGGLWEGQPVEAVATPEGFAQDPERVWRFYEARREQVATCVPNPGHLALTRLEANLGGAFTLTTQNVDGLHALAGSLNLLELHGSLWRVRCTRCDHRGEDRTVPFPAFPPVCVCGALLRPDIVWFGEILPEDIFEQSIEAARACDLFLVVGTSGIVEPAASLARLASRSGAEVWEVNPEPTPLTSWCSRSFRSGAGAVMDGLVEEILGM